MNTKLGYRVVCLPVTSIGIIATASFFPNRLDPRTELGSVVNTWRSRTIQRLLPDFARRRRIKAAEVPND